MEMKEIAQTVIDQFALDLKGTHGIPHWARVMENGRRLCDLNGANRKVVDLFALFHDSKRENEWEDMLHGERGAEYADEMQKHLNLTDSELELLMIACTDHSKGYTEGDITVRTCWDSDRLDLGRILIAPDPFRLCTDAAKTQEVRDWAYKKALAHKIPWAIIEEWGCSHMRFRGHKSFFWKTLGSIKRVIAG